VGMGGTGRFKSRPKGLGFLSKLTEDLNRSHNRSTQRGNRNSFIKGTREKKSLPKGARISESINARFPFAISGGHRSLDNELPNGGKKKQLGGNLETGKSSQIVSKTQRNLKQNPASI